MYKAILILVLFSGNIFAHLCHDPFIPQEHLVLVPEARLINIRKAGEFRIYIENTFRSTLRKVRLIVESDAFDIKIEPKEIQRLAPNERSFYTVKLTLKDGFHAGEYPLKIDVKAEMAILRPKIEELTVAATLPRETIPADTVSELLREEKLPATPNEYYKEDTPSLISEPSAKFDQIIREKVPARAIERLPVVVAKPKEELTAPKEEIPRYSENEVVVKVVHRRPLVKSVLYIFCVILIVGLIVIFIWRKIKG